MNPKWRARRTRFLIPSSNRRFLVQTLSVLDEVDHRHHTPHTQTITLLLQQRNELSFEYHSIGTLEST